MGDWVYWKPEEGKNWTLNPDAEATGNFVARGSATVTQDTTYSRHGIYSYKIVTTASGDGIDLTLSALAERAHYATLYLHGVFPNQLQASLDGTNWNDIEFLQSVPSNTLRENMAAYWPLNEVSGNALDATGNGVNLTDTASVTYYNDGDGPGWRQFSATTDEYFTVADNATLSGGDIDLAFEVEVVLDSKAISMGIATKGTSAATANVEYRLFYSQPLDRFAFTVSDGVTATTVAADGLGSPAVGTAYHLYAWHDSVNNIVGIRINDSTALQNTSAHSAGIQNTAGNFRVGNDPSGVANALDGRMRRLTFFKYRLPSASEITALYNGGKGMDYPGNCWARMGVSIPLAQASASTTLRIRQNGAGVGVFWIDSVQVEATNGYYTTYGDGDQPGWRWNGLRHGSTSTRDAQYRLGGRELNLQTDLGIRVIQEVGYGMPDQTNNIQDMSINPGAIHQSTKIGTRTLTLTLDFTTAPTTVTTLPGLHLRRKNFIDIIKASATRGDQPFVLGYKGANSGRTIYAQFRYIDGLKGTEIGSGGTVLESAGKVPVTLLAVDPFWYADDRDTAVLDFTDALTILAGTARIDGDWVGIGTGFNDTVLCMAIDKVRVRIYWGGVFTTLSGVTVNRFCYTDLAGNNATAVGGATKGVAGGDVYSLAVAPNGDVWGVGAFTSAGGAATKGAFKYNVATDTFTIYNTGTTGPWACVVIDHDGVVYLFGLYINWMGVAAADFCASTADAGTTWLGLGTSPFSATDYPGDNSNGQIAAIDNNNDVIVGSVGTGASTGKLRKYNKSTATWTTLAVTAAAEAVDTVCVLPNNNYMTSGTYSILGGVTAARCGLWNGTTVVPLSTGLDVGAVSIAVLPNGLVLFVGSITTAGGLLVSSAAYWNGYTWTQLDLSIFAASPIGFVVVNDYGDIYIGAGVHGGASATSGRTTVTPTATETIYPVVTITGPTTANTSCTLLWLENQTTKQICYFNLSVRTGEIVTIDFRTNSNLLITSNWRGEITDQPLDNSDFDLKLLPGANVIATLVTGTTTGVNVLMSSDVPHLAVDGAAA